MKSLLGWLGLVWASFTFAYPHAGCTVSVACSGGGTATCLTDDTDSTCGTSPNGKSRFCRSRHPTTDSKGTVLGLQERYDHICCDTVGNALRLPAQLQPPPWTWNPSLASLADCTSVGP